MTPYLAKSDFKVARKSATKLRYKVNDYPTTLDEDFYMELLADAGFIVGKFATLPFPEEIMIPSQTISAMKPKTRPIPPIPGAISNSAGAGSSRLFGFERCCTENRSDTPRLI